MADRLSRRDFLSSAVSFALAGALAGRALGAQARKPNIVFIMADDLGYGHLGCYGQKHIKTPHIDRMAKEGVRFTQCYAGSAVCAPSRSVLMTGLHAGHTPIRANGGGQALLPEDVTVAEVLKAAGYATGTFGKWGLGDWGTTGVPSKQGFDEYFGYLHQVHAHRYYVDYLWKNDERYPLAGNAGGKRGQYSHDVIMEEALSFVRRNRERPFFLYLTLTIPHVELIVPEASMKEYLGKFEETPFDEPREGYADPTHPKATLAAMISHMDRGVGELMALLKELGIDEDTLVFFTSDNGAQGGYGSHPEFFEATGGLRGVKTQLYEGGIRVPMIARWPGKIAAGGVSELPWQHCDVMATLAEVAGAEAPKETDGISVVPALLGERDQRRHEYLYWELQNGPRAPFQQAVRLGDWKGYRKRGGAALELYDLKNDVGESKDVASRNPEVVAKIERIMKAARTEPRAQVEPALPPGKKFQ